MLQNASRKMLVSGSERENNISMKLILNYKYIN